MALYVSLYPSSRYGFVTPHTSPAYHSPTLTELLQQYPTATATATAASYEVMQNLRFPTPPITPPRTHTVDLGADESETTPQQPTQQQQPIEPEQPQQRRTQSVIMKIGQGSHGLPPQHVATEISILNNAQMINDRRLITTAATAAAALDDEATCSESSTASNEYICDWIDCGRFFDTLESLAGHVNQIHAVASPLDGLYYCRWSGCQRTERGFNARYKMLVHTRTHTKEKPHQCHLCDKSFSRAENLKIHIRSHSGERPYVCTFEGCSKKYSNSSDRFKHTRTHAMEKPYMCKVPGCQKKYTDPSSLRKHVKTFKHTAAQMLENGRGAPEVDSSQDSSPPLAGPFGEEHRSQSNGSLYREMSSPTQQHYYIGMETDQLEDYYYAAAGGGEPPLKPAANYWISSSLEQSHCAPLAYGEKMQPMELEPLDLRTHRS